MKKLKYSILLIVAIFLIAIVMPTLSFLLMDWLVFSDEDRAKNIYLPVKECIVLRTQCNESGLCGTLETYNCEDIKL